MFDKDKKFPLPRPEPSARPSNSKPGRLSIPNSLIIPIQPPIQSGVSPERFIKSQTHDNFMERADSVTGDSSLSSNPRLSPSNSSEASFSDEEESSSDERVRTCFLSRLFSSSIGSF